MTEDIAPKAAYTFNHWVYLQRLQAQLYNERITHGALLTQLSEEEHKQYLEATKAWLLNYQASYLITQEASTVPSPTDMQERKAHEDEAK